MRNTKVLLFILSLCSCNRKAIYRDDISDCQLASIILNQIDILDDHKDITEYMILITPVQDKLMQYKITPKCLDFGN